jgi:hypothetical protein
MTGLVEQIQADAINEANSVSSLLRKVKLAASKLQLVEVNDWVDKELNGYYGFEVPQYRSIHGQPVGKLAHGGWLPIQIPEVHDTISAVSLRDPIREIEQLLDSAKNGKDLIHQYPIDAVVQLNGFLNEQMIEAGVKFQATTLVGILDRVRTLVLEWALDLERAGVRGEGLQFNREERQKAGSTHIQIGTFSGNLTAGNVLSDSASITTNDDHSQSTTQNSPEVFDHLLAAIEQINESKRADVTAALHEMRAAYGRPTFISEYMRFMGIAADHLGVIAPFLPALAALLPG